MAASEKPYSFRTAVLAGSAAAGSVLVWAEPCICQPPNCCGRIAGACSGERAGFGAAGLSTATAMPNRHARKIATPAEREKLMHLPGFRASLRSLDHRAQEKVSIAS